MSRWALQIIPKKRLDISLWVPKNLDEFRKQMDYQTRYRLPVGVAIDYRGKWRTKGEAIVAVLELEMPELDIRLVSLAVEARQVRERARFLAARDKTAARRR